MSSSDVKIEKKKQIAPKVYIHQNNPIYDRKLSLIKACNTNYKMVAFL